MSGIDKYLSGSAIISALLGTSCCAIQLFLNAFSFGCAGLSTASLVALLGYNYRNETLDRHNKSLWVALGCSLLLRALPFVIDRINEPTVDTKTVEEVIDLDIEGCANAVHNALNSVDGVYQNSVSLDEKTAKVFVKGKKVTEQQVDDVLRPLGFRAKKAKQ